MVYNGHTLICGISQHVYITFCLLNRALQYANINNFRADPNAPAEDEPEAEGEFAPAPFSFFVEFADEGQGEVRAHVLEVRSHTEVNAVPARFALNITDHDAGSPQWAPPTHFGAGVFLVGNVLADPFVELQFQVGTLLP